MADGADVFVEGPGLAAILPLALSRSAGQKLWDSPFESVLKAGCREIEQKRVLFKNAAYRHRVLQAHADANGSEIFGE